LIEYVENTKYAGGSDVCAITAAKSRLEHDPDPKGRMSAKLEPVSLAINA
jgi:hypothetical protein